MQPNTTKRFYTPQFSETAAVTVRRLAWALDTPMTKTIDIIINELSLVFSPKDICPKCQDKSKCQSCAFHNTAAAA